jgi:sugar lactone lactonase YvrE
MSTPRITSITPPRTIAGGRVTIHGSGFPVSSGIPDVRIGTQAARVVFASPTELGVVVPALSSGRQSVQVGSADSDSTLLVGVSLATGLHQVDNPVFDRAGNLYLTYSGTRGQQVPVSIFRVTPGGARESFSSAVTNPTSMAMAPDGVLFVSSRFEGAVYRLAPDGSAEVYVSDLGIACGLAFAEDGTLFVGDRSGTIFEVSKTGKARTFATLPSSVAAFHLARGADGLYVTAPTLSASDAVYHVSFDGEVSVMYSGFGRPQGLAFDPAGTLHVVEALAGVSGLYRLRDRSTPELVLSGPQLIGVAFDANGDLVVCSVDTAYRVPPLPTIS